MPNFFSLNNQQTSNTGPTEGITIPVQHSQGDVSMLGYPQMGDIIDDLLLYKASTGTYHRLTDESHNQFFNSVWKNDYKIKNHYLIESNSGYYFKFTVKDNYLQFNLIHIFYCKICLCHI